MRSLRPLDKETIINSVRKTKTGRSTDADTLEALREENPIVGLVLEWRQLSKLKGTYVDALRSHGVDPHVVIDDPALAMNEGRAHDHRIAGRGSLQRRNS